MRDRPSRGLDGDQGSAPFTLNTLIFADEGKTMRGEDIKKMIEKAKRDDGTSATIATTRLHRPPDEPLSG